MASEDRSSPARAQCDLQVGGTYNLEFFRGLIKKTQIRAHSTESAENWGRLGAPS